MIRAIFTNKTIVFISKIISIVVPVVPVLPKQRIFRCNII